MNHFIFEKLESRKLLTAAIVGTGTGLLASYYNNIDFTGGVHHRVDKTVNWQFGFARPAGGIDPNTFSIIWQGEIQSQYAERYTFYTQSDDGIAVFLNGQEIINNLTLHETTQDSFSIKMRAGRKYPLVIEYFQDMGIATAQLLWSSASTPMEVVPESQLYPVIETVPAVVEDLTPPAGQLAPADEIFTGTNLKHVWD